MSFRRRIILLAAGAVAAAIALAAVVTYVVVGHELRACAGSHFDPVVVETFCVALAQHAQRTAA